MGAVAGAVRGSGRRLDRLADSTGSDGDTRSHRLGPGCGAGRDGGCALLDLVLPSLRLQRRLGPGASASAGSGTGSAVGSATGPGSAVAPGATTADSTADRLGFRGRGGGCGGRTTLTRRGGGRLGATGFGGSARLPAALLRLHDRRVEEHLRRRRDGDPALPGEPLDELACDDLLDRARGALDLDAVIPPQQLHHFLAARVQDLRDFVNPDSGQSFPRSLRPG